MTYLHELQDDAKNPASGATLTPNCGELPRRVCRMCDNYREGGICAEAFRGTTSALEPADDKRCFVPRGTDAKAKPDINDTPEVRHAAERRRVKEPVTHKVCVTCGRDLPLDAFEPSRSERAVGGVVNQCRECHERQLQEARQTAAEKRAEKRREPAPIPTHKVCVTCGRDLPMEDFPVSASKYSKDGRRNQCRECRAAFYEKRRIHRTPEEKKAKRAESDRKYYERVKAKRAEADALNDADGLRVCQRCGRTLPLEEFPVNKRGTRFHACRECMHEARSKGRTTGGSGRPKKPRLTYTQQLAQGASQEQPVTDSRKKYATEEERRAARLASKRESNKRRYERMKAAVAEQAQAEQVRTSIDKAHNNALALGLDKVARCLAEAAEAMAELANIMNNK